MSTGRYYTYYSRYGPAPSQMYISCNSLKKKMPVDRPNLLQNVSFSVCATNNPNLYLNDISIKFEYLVV